MKLIICTLNFSPELTGIGKYSGEMAEWFAAAGHQVVVVTAPPYYPDWKISNGYSASSYRREISRIKSVSSMSQNDYEGEKLVVYRCPLWVPDRPSGLKRLLHLASFAISCFPVMLRQVFWRPDVVWVVAPAFFCAPGAWLTAKLAGVPACLHVQDYEVDAAFNLGLLKGVWLKKLVLWVERWLFARFDIVSTISYRMLDRARDKGVAVDRALLFPNWVDISAIHPGRAGGRYREELGIAPDKLVALYSGNMGHKQGLEILATAARLQKGNDHLFFVLCGNGAGRAELEVQCAGLTNVLFMDLQPQERLGDLLTMADIHLLPQREDAADLVMPSKLTGMLASGRPVVATACSGTEVARVVDGCGLVVPPGDGQAFSDAIGVLAGDPAQRTRFGLTARNYAEEKLDKEAVLRRFENDLKRLVEKSKFN